MDESVRLTFHGPAGPAVHVPVVVAVVVRRARASLEQQPVLAALQCQRAVAAQVELVAQLGMRVGLDAFLLGALDLRQRLLQ